MSSTSQRELNRNFCRITLFLQYRDIFYFVIIVPEEVLVQKDVLLKRVEVVKRSFCVVLLYNHSCAIVASTVSFIPGFWLLKHRSKEAARLLIMDCCPAHPATSGDSPTIVDHTMQALSYTQIIKLDEVLKQPVEIHSRNSFPQLTVLPLKLAKVVKEKLIIDGIVVHDVRLNGSAASYCIADDKTNSVDYKDLDLIFHVTIRGERDFHFIKEHVLQSLLDFFPDGISKDRLTTCTLEEAYVHKQVKVNAGYQNGDRWSLISLHNDKLQNLDLKFVDKMNRQYQFSTDSFQILLDSYFQLDGLDCIQNGTVELKSTFFPTVQAFSAYGNFSEAEYHLNNRLIKTKSPEEIRGGGLFKYCHLLAKLYKPYDCEEIELQERTMCTRFFIDFSEPNRQNSELLKYFHSHYGLASSLRTWEGVYFLEHLLTVLRRSAVHVQDCAVRNFENVVTTMKTIHLCNTGLVTVISAPSPTYRTHARKNSGGYLQSPPATSQSNGVTYSYAVPTRVSTPPGSYAYVITSPAVASNTNSGNF